MDVEVQLTQVNDSKLKRVYWIFTSPSSESKKLLDTKLKFKN